MAQKMLVSALFAGLAAGLIAAALQFVFVQPVLLAAEQYESGEVSHFGGAPIIAGEHAGHDHSHGVLGVGAGFDLRRDALSVMFSVLVFSAYGMVLVAAMAIAALRGHSTTARQGMIWGVAGFLAVQFAPAFGLPPEVPGVAAAEVLPRQIWWFATIIATAAGLWFFAFERGVVFWAAGVILILLPHIVGAPQPNVLVGPAPPEIASLFASRALGAGLVAWVVLGLTAATIWSRNES